MSRPARVLLGVILGALIALWVHPYSRPRLFSPLLSWGRLPELEHAPELLTGVDRLPQPKDLMDYSLWMEATAQRILSRMPTSEREWANLTEAARRAAQLEPGNAFWLQMQAAVALARRRPNDAQAAWTQAAVRSQWDDGQTLRMLRLRNRIAQRRGEGAWIASAVAPLRTTYAARAIEAVARDVAKTAPLTSRSGLQRRYETLLNGKLIRDGAKSMATAEVGIAMIELASYTSNLSSISSPRKLLLARVELYEALRTRYAAPSAEVADRAFRDNDSWLGYPNSSEANQRTRDLALLGALANGTGPVLLVVSIVGLGLLALSQMLEGPAGLRLLAPPMVGGVAAVFATFAYADTGEITLALAAAAAFGFMAFGPKSTRSRPILALGPLHVLLSMIVGLLFVCSVALGLATHLALGTATLGTVDLPAEVLGGRDPAAATAILAGSLLAVVSAFYGLVHRLSPSLVFVTTLRRVAVALAWLGVLAAVLGAPALMLLDRSIAVEAKQRLENEPLVYYLGD